MCRSEDGKQGGAMQEEVPHMACDGPLVKRPFVLGG